MKLVIDIDERAYKTALNKKNKIPEYLAKHESMIANGKPLSSVIDEIKAEIRHFMFEVNPSSSESDYACNYILDLIDKKMGK